MYRLVEQGVVDPSRYVQIGLRGYWPGEEEFGWQAEHGHHQLLHARRARPRDRRGRRARRSPSSEPARSSSRVDVDVLDPAFAPGTGTPEPGGMTSADLLWACRTIAAELELVGAEVVEVIPTAVGSADITALVADRIVREILTGIALAR